MNAPEKIKFIRDNVLLYFEGENYHLDYCDKCQKVIMDNERNWSDEDFLPECLACNKKICNECCIETCSMNPTYCGDCKDPEKDLIECKYCNRKCFESCSINHWEGGKLEVDGIECCQHCWIDLDDEIEEMKKVKLIKKAT